MSAVTSYCYPPQYQLWTASDCETDCVFFLLKEEEENSEDEEIRRKAEE